MHLEEARKGMRAYPALNSSISDTQIERVLQSIRTYRDHPLYGLLHEALGRTSTRQVITNTEQAVKALRGGPVELHAWLTSRIETATQVTDFTNAASALGELRAAGGLLQAGLTMEPQKERNSPQSDLRISAGQETTVVEIATKLMNHREAQQIQNHQAAIQRELRTKSRPYTYVSEPLVIRPGGSPTRPEETVSENAGHKFASIKPGARQAAANEPSILWVDVQDEDWSPAATSRAEPVVSWNGSFTSDGIWHGFYGDRGVPTFEDQAVERRAIERTNRQTYPGLFAQYKVWSAAILSFPQATILLEHPDPAVGLSPSLMESLLSLPWFRYENSWMNWPPGVPSVAVRVQQTISDLQHLAVHAKYTW